MSVFVESRIAFDFTNAATVMHYGTLPHGSVWPGVDFVVEEIGGRRIWLEVKNWEPAHLAPKDRGGSRWSFLCKMRSKPFAVEMRDKFLGTTSYLAWKGMFALTPTVFVLLFQPPHPLDDALMLAFQNNIKAKIPSRCWNEPIEIAIVTLAGWNQRYPDYPASLV